MCPFYDIISHMSYNSKDLKEMANAVRAGALHALRMARSGHVGIVLGAATAITAVFANALRVGRDKFVMSAGHGSALLYSVLNLAGYDIGGLGTFRKMGGLPGHPEFGIDGVDATTGPLGQGVANAVGIALAEKMRNSDGCVYCLCSDGDLMEGVAQEAIAFAGRYKLNNLVLIWDDNGMTIDGVAQGEENIPARMMAAGWKITTVDGEKGDQITRAMAVVNNQPKPVFVQCKTQIGFGSSLAGQNKAHGLALSDAELAELINKFISPAGESLWADVAKNHFDMLMINPSMDVRRAKMPAVSGDVSTRELSGLYINEIIKSGFPIIGGSADLGGSTNARVDSSVDVVPGVWNGNYINYGVREHAMAAIMNGISSVGLRTYGSTFLVFSDYMRPAMRLAALSGIPSIFVLTHDSVAVGEDGPTHQPIEQLASLRLMPNMNVFRPCNADEVAVAWQMALQDNNSPSSIVLSRQKFKQIETPRGADVRRGGYVIVPANSGRVRATIIATGAEVPLAVDVAKKLGDGIQVVSMPSVGHFKRQTDAYKQGILRGFVVVIEAGASAPWFEFADAVVGIDEFGVSGPGAEVYAHFGFDAYKIAESLKKNIK